MATLSHVRSLSRGERCPNCGQKVPLSGPARYPHLYGCESCGKVYCEDCHPSGLRCNCDAGSSASRGGGGGVAVGVGAASVGAGVGSVLKGAGSVLGGFGSYMNDGLKQAQDMRAEEEAEYQKASEFIQKIPTHRFSDDPAEIVEEIYKIASMVKQFTPYRLRYTGKSNNLRRVYESAAPKMKQGIEKLETLAERARKTD